MKKYITTSLWAITATLYATSGAYAGITTYNPADNYNSAINTGSSGSLGGVRQESTITPNAQQQFEDNRKKQQQINSKIRNDNILNGTHTTTIHNSNTQVVENIANTESNEGKYGNLILILRPAVSYNMPKLAALSRLFNNDGVTAEYYTADVSPQEVQRNIQKISNAPTNKNGPALTPAKIEFYTDQVSRLPHPTVDAENMLSNRYNIKAYPAVIYTTPKGDIFHYDFSRTTSSNKIVESILSKIDYVKRGIK